jgi:hypothetical protein
LLLAAIRDLKGRHRVTIVKEFKGRTLSQNAYYWSCVVSPWAEWLIDMGHEISDDNEEAHGMLANRFLERSRHDSDGVIIGTYIESTSKLTTVEFGEYIEQCAQFLAQFCSIVVEPPNPFYETSSPG